MKILLKKLHMENFKKTKDQTIDFGHITKISGQNAVGKSTVADAFMWCLFNKNSLGEAKFQVRPLDAFGNPIDHVEIKVAVTLDVDGREYELTKTQKQNWVKKRGAMEATLQGNDNLYEIDGAPKKEKDYKAFVAEIIDEDLFQLLTNPQAFVSKKWKEQREELMKMIPGVDNDTVIASNPDVLSELNLALSLHTPEDLQAKAKKALSEYKKKQTEIPARVDEVRKSMTDIDVAELELQRNGLKEQIAIVEKSEADMTAQYEAHQKVTDDLMDLKFALSDVERKANERNVTKKNSFIDELAQYENDITSCKRRMEICDQNIRDADGTISAYEKKRAEMHEKWIAEKEKVYSDTLAFDEKETVCPLCGQSYPADKIAQIKAEFEEKKVALKANWEKEHTDALERIVADGNRYKDLISRTQEKIVDLRTNQEKIKVNLQSAETERDRVIKLLKSLPDKVDCSENAEYQKLQEQITLKEEYLSKMNSGAEIRQQLKIKKNGLMDELAIVEKQIASADNSAKEERIEELEAEMREIAQSVADEEKMLYLLEKFMKAKMMILSKMVNEKFGIVNWKLFDKQVNGAVVECCECMVNGVPYSALNTGHRIVAGLDIIHALSVMHDVTAPIFVDNAEAVNDYNIPEMEGQLVLLQVTDDKELKVEREDMRND